MRRSAPAPRACEEPERASYLGPDARGFAKGRSNLLQGLLGWFGWFRRRPAPAPTREDDAPGIARQAQELLRFLQLDWSDGATFLSVLSRLIDLLAALLRAGASANIKSPETERLRLLLPKLVALQPKANATEGEVRQAWMRVNEKEVRGELELILQSFLRSVAPSPSAQEAPRRENFWK